MRATFRHEEKERLADFVAVAVRRNRHTGEFAGGGNPQAGNVEPDVLDTGASGI